MWSKMTARYSYEFKKFKSGSRKKQEYCNIRSVKTGKVIKTVSSKANLSSAHKAVGQQKRRAKDEKAWANVEDDVKKSGGTRKQYERAVKRERAANTKAIKEDPKARKLGRGELSKRASRKVGVTTQIAVFFQVAAIPGAQPYTVGESNKEEDINISYPQWQEYIKGDSFKYELPAVREFYRATLDKAKSKGLHVFYGGYEVKVVDNETGNTLKSEMDGGYHPNGSEEL